MPLYEFECTKCKDNILTAHKKIEKKLEENLGKFVRLLIDNLFPNCI